MLNFALPVTRQRGTSMALTDADWTQRGVYVVLLISGTIFVLLCSLQLRHNELYAELERLRIRIDETSEAAARLARAAASPETRGAGRSGL